MGMDCTTSAETRGGGVVICSGALFSRSWRRRASQLANPKGPNHHSILQSPAKKNASSVEDLFFARISIAVDIWWGHAVKAKSARAVITSAFDWSKTGKNEISESCCEC